MVFDALTLSAIIVAIVFLFVLVFVLRTAEQKTEIRLRKVAEQSVLITQEQSARELCQKIREKYPDACPGLDYVVEMDAKSSKPHVKEWNLPGPKPSDEGN